MSHQSRYSEADLQRVWDEVSGRSGSVVSTECNPNVHFTFRKVYVGPGYPKDPKNDKDRLLACSLNLIPLPLGTVDIKPLKNWLLQSSN